MLEIMFIVAYTWVGKYLYDMYMEKYGTVLWTEIIICILWPFPLIGYATYWVEENARGRSPKSFRKF